MVSGKAGESGLGFAESFGRNSPKANFGFLLFVIAPSLYLAEPRVVSDSAKPNQREWRVVYGKAGESGLGFAESFGRNSPKANFGILFFMIALILYLVRIVSTNLSIHQNMNKAIE